MARARVLYEIRKPSRTSATKILMFIVYRLFKLGLCWRSTCFFITIDSTSHRDLMPKNNVCRVLCCLKRLCLLLLIFQTTIFVFIQSMLTI